MNEIVIGGFIVRMVAHEQQGVWFKEVGVARKIIVGVLHTSPLTTSAYTCFHVGLSLASVVGFLEHFPTELA